VNVMGATATDTGFGTLHQVDTVVLNVGYA
jgi:hypothetical protein